MKKNIINFKNFFFRKIVFVLFIALLYLLTVRGNWHNPTPSEIDKLKSQGQSFETSQERSRYAIILSLLEDKKFSIDKYAFLGTPDIGLIKGHYFSLFPPGASILAIPLYLIGVKIGAAQISTFLISTIFAFLTILLIVKFAKRLGASSSTSLFAGLAFGFATNAWGYSVTFYAHLISAFLILAGLYIASLKKNHKSIELLLFWFLYALAVFIDFPNAFIFLPIAMILTFNVVDIEEVKDKLLMKIKWKYLLTPLLFVSLMGLYGYYNYYHFGSPTTLSNTIPRVKDLQSTEENAKPEEEKESVSALETRNMLDGFQSFTTNLDRGIIIYSPVVLLAFLSLFGAYQKLNQAAKIGLFGVPAICLTLYTMFGDPYGGWAFGSRYMIAIFPELCILLALALTNLHHKILVKVCFTIVFLYSMGVSLLAPLTTNVIPPRVEAIGFGLIYDYRINIGMMNRNEINSFVYNNFANKYLSSWQYYSIIFALVGIVGTALIWYKPKHEEK